jgi:CheY-like chemotaxis protein
MSGDLVSLRMVAVLPAAAEHELWRQGAGLSSIPVELSSHDGASGAASLGKGGVDICLVDNGLPAAELAAVIAAARSLKPGPLVFVSGAAGSARPDGADGMLGQPSNATEARKLVEICVRTKLPTRVLIVDDSGIVRKILSGSRFTLDLHEAAEGFKALEKLRTEKFGLVFLDYNMPGFNGLETLSEIRREAPKVAVVMMTSTLDNALADRAYAAGALAFLKKPFYPADIDRVLQRYFGVDGAA